MEDLFTQNLRKYGGTQPVQILEVSMEDLFTQNLRKYGGTQPVQILEVTPTETPTVFPDLFAATQSERPPEPPPLVVLGTHQSRRLNLTCSKEYPKWLHPDPPDPEDHARGTILVQNRGEEMMARLKRSYR